MANTITIERTAKRYKFRLCLSVIGLIVGIFWLVFAITNNDPATGAEIGKTKPIVITSISLALWIITKIQIWWNHG